MKTSTISRLKTILIVDDEPCLLALLTEILTRDGYYVYKANNGIQAVELYQNNHASIDIVVMDITMPKMDGLTAHKELQKINPNVLVILMSGYSHNSIENNNHQHFIRKPMPPAALLNKIKEILDTSPSEQFST